ncbi:TetR/AcrR family transcriptional regulator [Kitasatospora cheerisanensis]|nr:TetR/AcrR family transcriptional regulator [Kitasatospora cheerisanensis]
MTMDQPDRPQPADGPAEGTPLRRRGKALEAAIFEAALDQLTSGGFARMTMEGVAGAAQTGKAALYRRWASKADLVMDALVAAMPPPADFPDLGSAEAELRQVVHGYIEVLNSRIGAAVRTLMGELDHERAELFKGFLHERVIEPTTEGILGILRRGEARGDVRRGAAVPMVADVLPAMLLYRARVCVGMIEEDFCEELLGRVLLPMIRP